MSLSRKSCNEHPYENAEKKTILDGIKNAEAQCAILRQQLQLLGKVLARNFYEQFAVSQMLCEEAAGGEGQFSVILDNTTNTAPSVLYAGDAISTKKKENFIEEESFYSAKADSPRQNTERPRKVKNRHRYVFSGEGKHHHQQPMPVVPVYKSHESQDILSGCELIKPKQSSLELRLNSAKNSSSVFPTRQLKEVTKVNIMPFVVGTSTSKSHNICLNFQEVLAKLKHRQPVVIEPVEHLKVKEPDPVLPLTEAGEPLPREEKRDLVKCKMFLSEDERERKFKDVLRTLYSEFTTMTQEYEKLMKAYTLKESNKVLLKKQLKKLDKTLGQKEDEIIVLIGMYREVMSMKEAATKSIPDRIQKSPATFVTTTNLRYKCLLHQIRQLQDHLSQL